MAFIAEPIVFILFMFMVSVIDTWKRKSWGLPLDGSKGEFKEASKLDEEGMEVAVCRHGLLLKALQMDRGEIFAYPSTFRKS